MADRNSLTTDADAGRPEQEHHDDDQDDPKGKKTAVKKRTKTGCLSEYSPPARQPPSLAGSSSRSRL